MFTWNKIARTCRSWHALFRKFLAEYQKQFTIIRPTISNPDEITLKMTGPLNNNSWFVGNIDDDGYDEVGKVTTTFVNQNIFIRDAHLLRFTYKITDITITITTSYDSTNGMEYFRTKFPIAIPPGGIVTFDMSYYYIFDLSFLNHCSYIDVHAVSDSFDLSFTHRLDRDIGSGVMLTRAKKYYYPSQKFNREFYAKYVAPFLIREKLQNILPKLEIPPPELLRIMNQSHISHL